MIQAINSINSNQNNINFEGRRKFKAKKIKKAFKELPYTLGLKKKKTVWDKIKEFFVPKKTFGEKVSDFFTKETKSVKKNCKNGGKLANKTEEEPKKDGLLTVLGKDLVERIKKADEILNS